MSKTYTFTAKRWRLGWELWLDGQAATQVRTLANAEQQARDWIATVEDRDVVDDQIIIMPDLGSVLNEVAEAKHNSAAAARAQAGAAAQLRTVTAKLRAKGLSVTDVATILGVSRGRVSQLLAA